MIKVEFSSYSQVTSPLKLNENQHVKIMKSNGFWCTNTFVISTHYEDIFNIVFNLWEYFESECNICQPSKSDDRNLMWVLDKNEMFKF